MPPAHVRQYVVRIAISVAAIATLSLLTPSEERINTERQTLSAGTASSPKNIFGAPARAAASQATTTADGTIVADSTALQQFSSRGELLCGNASSGFSFCTPKYCCLHPASCCQSFGLNDDGIFCCPEGTFCCGMSCCKHTHVVPAATATPTVAPFPSVSPAALPSPTPLLPLGASAQKHVPPPRRRHGSVWPFFGSFLQPYTRIFRPGVGALCFPASATARRRDGSRVRLDRLQVGDEVAAGGGTFSPVIFFSHADDAYGSTDENKTPYVRLTTESGHAVTATAGHMVPVVSVSRNWGNEFVGAKQDELVAAARVRVGQRLRTVRSGARGGSDRSSEDRWGELLSAVVNIERVSGRGLYNPHTLDGRIEVDGVVCSAYTTAVHATTAHGLLAPVRALHRLQAATLLSFHAALAK